MVQRVKMIYNERTIFSCEATLQILCNSSVACEQPCKADHLDIAFVEEQL